MSVIVDTSVLVALVRLEPDRDTFINALRNFRTVLVPASCYLEFTIVGRSDPRERHWLNVFCSRDGIAIAPIDGDTARIAADAYSRFGRGSGSPARLNFGDCLSYAVARQMDAPLLFKGDDFRHIDVKAAL